MMRNTLNKLTGSRGFSALKNGVSTADGSLQKVSPWLVFLSIAVIIFNYFDIHHNLWFLNLLDGYVIKMWLPPLTLFLLIFSYNWLTGNRDLPLKGMWPLIVCLILYVLFGLLSLFTNEQIYFVGKYGLIMFGPVILYGTIFLVFTNRKQIRIGLELLFWVGVLLSIYVFYFYDIVGVYNWKDRPYVFHYMWSGGDMNLGLTLNILRDKGYFAYSRTLHFVDEPRFAAMLAPLVLFGFYKAIQPGARFRLLYYLPSFFLFWTMLNTGSRSSFIAFLVGLAVFLYFIRKRVLHVILILILVAGLTLNNDYMKYRMFLLAGTVMERALSILPESKMTHSIRRYMVNVYKEIESKVSVQPEGHVEGISMTMEDIKKAPFLGSGITFMLEKYRVLEKGWGTEHNRYLYLLATAGFLTMVPYLLFILSLIYLSLRTFYFYIRNGRTLYDIGVILAPSVLLFAIQINNAGQERYYYWVFFGLATAWMRNVIYERKHEHSSN
jgi:hypothetical protein